jgi:hypothetical protein
MTLPVVGAEIDWIIMMDVVVIERTLPVLYNNDIVNLILVELTQFVITSILLAQRVICNEADQ